MFVLNLNTVLLKICLKNANAKFIISNWKFPFNQESIKLGTWKLKNYKCPTHIKLIEQRLLKCFGHLKKMKRNRIPKYITEVEYRGQEEKGEAEVRRSKGLAEEDAEDREAWRSKMFLLIGWRVSTILYKIPFLYNLVLIRRYAFKTLTINL